jgi:hypothetical protein
MGTNGKDHVRGFKACYRKIRRRHATLEYPTHSDRGRHKVLNDKSLIQSF